MAIVRAAGSWYGQRQNMYLAIVLMPPATSPATTVQQHAVGKWCQNVVIRGNIYVISDKQRSKALGLHTAVHKHRKFYHTFKAYSFTSLYACESTGDLLVQYPN